uniref:Retrotransposon gag domain-containing protein n=1 Tax=Tanacetum cinerariifolium TaxID=118510 RepID=A0A699JFN7_TANCI|nr:hypothetical protein [Tanacetum cinerariifolium]
MKDERPEYPREIFSPIYDISQFRFFIKLIEFYDPVANLDNEPMWAADRIVAPTPGPAITIPETANEFAIKYEFDEGTIEMWDELCTAFIFRFFPPDLFDQLLEEIQAFSQHENETLTETWLRMKEMLRNCHGHNLSKGNIIKIFYHGLNEMTQEVLNVAFGGSSNSDTDKIMAQMDAMTMKIDDQYREFQSRSKQPNLNHNDDDKPMSLEEEAKFMQTFHRTRFVNTDIHA